MAEQVSESDRRDHDLMRIALDEAARARGRTRPNPMVGAVIVRDGEIVARGFHARAGEDHAEVIALKRAGARARGAEMFVNLEPCSHHGRTPPCADALIAAGIRRVVAAMIDPNPRVSGQGIERLRAHGIDVRVGVLGEEARRLNEAFVTHAEMRRPLVTLKLAGSLDGRIATRSGESRWITGPEARKEVHALRAEVDAILVGATTLRVDDPQLTVRAPAQPILAPPLRVALDSHLRAPVASRLFETMEAPTLVFCAEEAPVDAERELLARGVQVRRLRRTPEGLPLDEVLRTLASLDVQHLLVEGGGTLAAALLAEGFVDHLRIYWAPLLIGGRDAPMLLGDPGVDRLADARRATVQSLRRVGEDICLEALLEGRPLPAG